jgi:hypothetical protein
MFTMGLSLVQGILVNVKNTYQKLKNERPLYALVLARTVMLIVYAMQ